jgi:hypothetical protein
MPKPSRSIDVTDMPELLRLAEEVNNSNSTRVLKRGDLVIARLSPPRRDKAPRTDRPRPAASPVDWLERLAGAADLGVHTDIARLKDDYLAEAYRAVKPNESGDSNSVS